MQKEEIRLKEWGKKFDEERERANAEQFLKEEELKLIEEERRRQKESELTKPEKLN